MRSFILFLFIYMIIGVIWKIIDTLEFGKPQFSIADTFFALILADMIRCRILSHWSKSDEGRDRNAR